MKNKIKNIDKIHSLDKQLLLLLDRRISLIKNEKLEYSRINSKLISKLENCNTENLHKAMINSVFSEIFLITNKYEENNKIAYLGPEGSYTHESAINKFGLNNNYYSVNSIRNIFFEIEKGRARYGVVPIENSSNGIVGDTINSLNNYNLNIVGETILDIHHTLVSNCRNIKDIKTIYSKDIAFDQCSNFLENYHLNDAKYVYVDSTTKAALLAAKTKNSAAICSKLAAKTINIPVLFSNIEDNKDNKTRFLVISKENIKKTKSDKTSIIVQLPNIYGSLIEFLNDFKNSKINLNKIKSHIVKGISTFFIEFEGNKSDKKVEKVLKKHNKYIKILGSYPKEIEDI
ncbi:MAG: prephenate dehydratase [Poseidonibacter sp.]|uniref:prephenate dehydratase n=1 Tax=Poseidonibacter sp. TaxID=2321188 RepID=UPI00359D0C94